GSARGQMQECTAGKFHFESSLSLYFTRPPRRRGKLSLCVRAGRQAHREHRAPTRLARHAPSPSSYGRAHGRLLSLTRRQVADSVTASSVVIHVRRLVRLAERPAADRVAACVSK